jgi:hypothetical protein
MQSLLQSTTLAKIERKTCLFGTLAALTACILERKRLAKPRGPLHFRDFTGFLGYHQTQWKAEILILPPFRLSLHPAAPWYEA